MPTEPTEPDVAQHPHDDSQKSAAAEVVAARVREALGGVVDPCCRDRGISVVDMGLLSDVAVDGHGTARVEILLTSGWCPFQVDLLAEVGEAAASVPGVRDTDVRISLQQVWSPERMSASARRTLRLLPDPVDAGNRDRYLQQHPLPIATAPQEA